ncbi:MAG: hypothetical protein ACE5M4_00895 [Anaerolineales bacterium]
MKWLKQGLIYVPDGESWWAKSHAFNPTAEVIDNQVLRVYFASLDENRYGRIGYVELDADNPQRILYETREPVLDTGEAGTFDDSGVNPSCIISVEDKKYLYYIGWQRCERVPYMLFAGLAISDDNGLTLEKYSRTPILDRTIDEPFSRSAPFVLSDDGTLKMWYWSCVKWSKGESGVHYNNVIRYATSKDGIRWSTHKHVCVEPDFVDEYSVGRPWVIKDGQLYKMWFSIRSFKKLYTIGYAESADGVSWVRKDAEVGIGKSDSGWDSEMICFPCVVDVRERRYMFYNGNQQGLSGFGYAILES